MGELPSQLDTNLRTLDRLQLERQITNDALRSAEDRKNMVERQLSEIGIAPGGVRDAATGVVSSDPVRRRLAELKAELSQLSSLYTDKYPDIVRVKREIAALESQGKTGNGMGAE